MANLYKNLNTLKPADVFKLEVDKYMHQLNINSLPKSLCDDYVKINETHNYDTKQIGYKIRSILNLGLVYRGLELWKTLTNPLNS